MSLLPGQILKLLRKVRMLMENREQQQNGCWSFSCTLFSVTTMVFLGFYLVLDLSCCVSYQLIWKFEVFFTCFKLGYDIFVVVLIHGCHNTPPCLKVHSIVIMAIYTHSHLLFQNTKDQSRDQTATYHTHRQMNAKNEDLDKS